MAGDDAVYKAVDALGYSGVDKAKNIAKDVYGAVVGANYEALAHNAGEAAGKVLKRVGTAVGSTIDGIEAVQNIQKGSYRDAAGNICSIGGGIVGGAVVGAAATPETLGAATIPAALAGSYAGGKVGEAGCKWLYDKISLSTPDLDEALSNVSLTTTERDNVLAAVNTALPKQYNVTDAYFENGILNVQYLNANNRSDDRIREFEIAQVKDIPMDKSVQVAHNQEQTLQMDLVARQQSQGQSLSL